MEEITKEMQEIIKKNLPAHVGDVLKQRLNQADADAALVKSLTEELKSRNALVTQQQAKLEEYAKSDARNAALDKRESEIAERERNQKVWEAEHKVAEAEKRCNEMAGFVGLVFKSPVFRKTTMAPSYGMYTQNGQYAQTGGGDKTEIATEE